MLFDVLKHLFWSSVIFLPGWEFVCRCTRTFNFDKAWLDAFACFLMGICINELFCHRITILLNSDLLCCLEQHLSNNSLGIDAFLVVFVFTAFVCFRWLICRTWKIKRKHSNTWLCMKQLFWNSPMAQFLADASGKYAPYATVKSF